MTDRCPLCDDDTRFVPFGVSGARPRAMCGRCGSLERHRLIALVVEREGLLRRERTRVLHVAPEEAMGRWLRAHPGVEYLSIDLESPMAMRHMDLTALELDDDTFDLIVCSHVLEHIPDDRSAMSELHRVLAPGGALVVQVPIGWGLPATDEDPSVTDPAERQRRWGQHDHVRLYGQDLVDRLAAAGLDVTVIRATELAGPDERHGLSLMDSDAVHLCRVPASVVTVGSAPPFLVAVLSDGLDAATETAVHRAQTLGDVVVLDRSGAGSRVVAGAEVIAVDWEDDDAVRRFVSARERASVLFTSDREELIVLDREAAIAGLGASPLALLATSDGEQLRAFPGSEVLALAGSTGPAVVPGLVARPPRPATISTSIVIPTFNRPDTVATAVRSALLQSDPDVEIVVVNDAGLDPRSWLGGAVHASSVRVVDAEANGGLGAARNIGMEHAAGASVLFLDDDDVIDRSHVADLAAALGSTSAPMVNGGAIMVHLDADGNEVARYRRPAPDFDRRLLLVHNYIVVHTALTRLDAARAVGGFDTTLGVLEDWEFWIRLTASSPAETVPVWSAEYRLRDAFGANVINHSAGVQLRTMERIHAAHPVSDRAVVEQRRQIVEEHRRAYRASGDSWASTVGVIGHADPERTLRFVEELRRRHPATETQVIVHQPAHDDADEVMSRLLGQATVCVDRSFDPDRIRERIGVQALGATLDVIDLTDDPVPAGV